MKLTGKYPIMFELEVLGYKQVERTGHEWNDNWLRILTKATLDLGDWQSVDACLTTAEVADLAAWLEDLADGRRVDKEMGFIDPYLCFVHSGVSDGLHYLRVYFELGLQPRWAKSANGGFNVLWADLACHYQDLHRSADSLRSQLARFPQR